MEPRSRAPSWPPTSCGPSRSTRGAGVIFELKPLTQEAIPKALEKAERYRLLKEPAQAESICLDVLQIDPGNQKAEAIRPAGNDDALLRWNTCARILTRNPHLQRGPEDHSEPPLE